MRTVQVWLERALDLIPVEGILSQWQKKKIARNPKTQIQGGLIQATSQALVFLPHPRGPRVYEQFKTRLRA